jgi:pyrroloquinoline quinone biosynthesis protein D
LPAPWDSSQPRLAAGCRWATQGEDQVVLYPEGMIRLEGPGRAILELCDGQKTFADIVTQLANQFAGADATVISKEAGTFLDDLRIKRIVDY